MEKRIAVFGGSFNPFTIGHASIVERGLKLFDRIVIAVGVNINKPTDNYDNIAEKIRAVYKGNDAVKVVVWNGLMAELAQKEGAKFLIRGIRSVADFEYERNMADINRRISGVDTVFLSALPHLSDISSSVLRELEKYGFDTESLKA